MDSSAQGTQVLPWRAASNGVVRVRRRLSSRAPGFTIAPILNAGEVVFIDQGSARGRMMVIAAPVVMAVSVALLLPEFQVPGQVALAAVLFFGGAALLCLGMALMYARTAVTVDRQGGLTEELTCFGLRLHHRRYYSTPTLYLHQIHLTRLENVPAWQGFAVLMYYDSRWMTLATCRTKELAVAHGNACARALEATGPEEGPMLMAWC
jgi:hypothetical protein